ncbi:unnamed protein product [Cladocopium goreaui]|uniref:Multidrug and toxin extrusion protein 2 n=1 Tax=Cladocopium goreaui TaxID=2562237 RepID=A0A9P1BN67_9DINO|nr:unnamed protein product [Cladocopium goreaui]
MATSLAMLWTLLWLQPVKTAGGLGDMADQYFASMSSPAVMKFCKGPGAKACCPESQCIPGMEMFSGCDAARGMTTCEAHEEASFFPVRNGVCRCGDGWSCETGKCIQMKDAAAFPAPAAENGGTVLKPLPELHRTLLDDKAKRQVHYRHAALMNWALLTVSAGTVLMLLLWGTRVAVRGFCAVEAAATSEERPYRHSEVQGLLLPSQAQVTAGAWTGPGPQAQQALELRQP